MAAIYDDVDLVFGWNGDLNLSDQGDLQDTSDNTLQSLLDQIHSICASALNDWEIYPNRGAGLDDFIGEPNTRAVGDRIHDRVRVSITAAGLVAEDDLKIIVVPVHIHKILIIIRISAIPSSFNKLLPNGILQTAVVFDSLEQQVFFLDQTPDLIYT